jgi:hypothetical protein
MLQKSTITSKKTSIEIPVEQNKDVPKQKTNIPKNLSETVNLGDFYLLWQIIDDTIKPDDTGKNDALNANDIREIRRNLSEGCRVLQNIFGIPEFSRLTQANNPHFPDTILSVKPRAQQELKRLLQLLNTTSTQKIFFIIKNTQHVYKENLTLKTQIFTKIIPQINFVLKSQNDINELIANKSIHEHIISLDLDDIEPNQELTQEQAIALAQGLSASQAQLHNVYGLHKILVHLPAADMKNFATNCLGKLTSLDLDDIELTPEQAIALAQGLSASQAQLEEMDGLYKILVYLSEEDRIIFATSCLGKLTSLALDDIELTPEQAIALAQGLSSSQVQLDNVYGLANLLVHLPAADMKIFATSCLGKLTSLALDDIELTPEQAIALAQGLSASQVQLDNVRGLANLLVHLPAADMKNFATSCLGKLTTLDLDDIELTQEQAIALAQVLSASQAQLDNVYGLHKILVHLSEEDRTNFATSCLGNLASLNLNDVELTPEEATDLVHFLITSKIQLKNVYGLRNILVHLPAADMKIFTITCLGKLRSLYLNDIELTQEQATALAQGLSAKKVQLQNVGGLPNMLAQLSAKDKTIFTTTCLGRLPSLDLDNVQLTPEQHTTAPA